MAIVSNCSLCEINVFFDDFQLILLQDLDELIKDQIKHLYNNNNKDLFLLIDYFYEWEIEYDKLFTHDWNTLH